MNLRLIKKSVGNDNMDFGSINGYVILGVLLLGFIAVSIILEVVGRNFAWHQKLE